MIQHIDPLADVVPYWNGDYSTYPEAIRVNMADGKTVRYVLEVKQPEPVFRDLLDRFNQTVFGGYKYKEKGKGKRRGDKSDEQR